MTKKYDNIRVIKIPYNQNQKSELVILIKTVITFLIRVAKDCQRHQNIAPKKTYLNNITIAFKV